MILVWLFGAIVIGSAFLVFVYGGVAKRHARPRSKTNVVLINSIAICGIFMTIGYLSSLRMLDAWTGLNIGSDALPGGFAVGMGAMNVFTAMLVWTGALRRADIYRLDSPARLSRSWWFYLVFQAVWCGGCFGVIAVRALYY